MIKRKSVSHPGRQHAPTSFAATLLDCYAGLGHDPNRLLKEARAPYTMRQLMMGEVDAMDVDIFTIINRTCNTALREHIERTGGGGMLTQMQFFLMCKCLIASKDLGEAIATLSNFFAMFEGRIGAFDLELAGEEARFIVTSLRRPTDDASYLVGLYGIAVMRMLFQWLIDRPMALDRVELSYPYPRCGMLHLTLFGQSVQFGQPRHCLVFSADYLASPIVRDRSDLMVLLRTFPFDLMLSVDEGKQFA